MIEKIESIVRVLTTMVGVEGQFRQYEAHHKLKGDAERATVNAIWADKTQALVSHVSDMLRTEVRGLRPEPPDLAESPEGWVSDVMSELKLPKGHDRSHRLDRERRIGLLRRALLRPGEHDLWLTGDPDVSQGICDGNGEVVLGECRRCGRGESELDLDHGRCPGTFAQPLAGAPKKRTLSGRHIRRPTDNLDAVICTMCSRDLNDPLFEGCPKNIFECPHDGVPTQNHAAE